MFSVDRWIGIAGLIFGIPGFILAFTTPDKAVAWLAVVLGLVLFAAAFLIRRASRLPPFRMNDVKITLDLKDNLGNEATLRKEYEAVPSYGHLQEMSHRNIAADGGITDLKWNDSPIDPTWIKQILGEYQITARFPGPLPRGKPFKCSLSYNAVSSFLQSQEGMVYVVDFPVRKVNITIRFPADRMCTRASAFRVQGAGKMPLPDPIVDAQLKTVTVTLRKPQVGAEIEIWWDW